MPGPPGLYRREHLPYEAAFLAGKAFRRYREAGGARTAPLPDFYIGAHAAVAGYRLLTRDARRYRTCFPRLELIARRHDRSSHVWASLRVGRFLVHTPTSRERGRGAVPGRARCRLTGRERQKVIRLRQRPPQAAIGPRAPNGCHRGAAGWAGRRPR